MEARPAPPYTLARDTKTHVTGHHPANGAPPLPRNGKPPNPRVQHESARSRGGLLFPLLRWIPHPHPYIMSRWTPSHPRQLSCSPSSGGPLRQRPHLLGRRPRHDRRRVHSNRATTKDQKQGRRMTCTTSPSAPSSCSSSCSVYSPAADNTLSQPLQIEQGQSDA